MKRYLSRTLAAALALILGLSVVTPFDLTDVWATGTQDPAYTVEIRETDGGSVRFRDMESGEDLEDTSRTFPPGDTVALTVAADEGYSLERLTVLDGEGEELEWEAGEEGEDFFTFTMAASDVAVSADFAEETESTVEENVSEVDTGETTAEETVSEPDTGETTAEEAVDETDAGEAPDGVAAAEEAVDETDAGDNGEAAVSEEDAALFASMCLILVADDASILRDGEDIIGQYENIYLISFSNIQETKEAYAYYEGLADAVEPDRAVQAADDGLDEYPDGIVTEESNPIDILDGMEDSDAAQEAGSVIALIDTGASEQGNVIDRVSVIDDALSGTNSHADSMVDAIVSQDPDAEILSIRAMDDSGAGTTSSLVAAVEYAIAQDVSIINLSLYGRATLASSVLEQEILKATDAGILVVGAAGNDGEDASGYIPGSIEEAYIIGACDETGSRLEISNYGATVDYNVAASSTSVATALFTGYVSAHGISSVADVLNQGLIFETDYAPEDDDADDAEEYYDYLHVYYLIYQGQDMEDVISNFIIKMPYDDTVTAEDGGKMLRTYINADPSRYDYNADGINMTVHINRAVYPDGETDITGECQYDADGGYMDIPEEYLGRHITVTVWQSVDSAFYQDFAASTMKTDEDWEESEYTVASYESVFPNGLSTYLWKLMKPMGCNEGITISGTSLDDFSVGDLWYYSGDTYYIGSLSDDYHVKWSALPGASYYKDAGFSAGQVISLTGYKKKGSGTTSSGAFLVGAGTAGKSGTLLAGQNWLFTSCISQVCNTFYGLPVFKQLYVECIEQDTKNNEATFFIHATFARASGTGTAQTMAGFFTASFEDDEPGSLLLEKTCSDEYAAVVEDNDFYSLKGAYYRLYTDLEDAQAAAGVDGAEGDADNYVLRLKTGSDGRSSAYASDRNGDTLSGTYYIVETTAPLGYQLDRGKNSLTVTNTGDDGETTEVTVRSLGNGIYRFKMPDSGTTTIHAADVPLYGTLSIQKKNADSNSSVTDLGNIYFRVEYYNTNDTSSITGPDGNSYTQDTDSDGNTTWSCSEYADEEDTYSFVKSSNGVAQFKNSSGDLIYCLDQWEDDEKDSIAISVVTLVTYTYTKTGDSAYTLTTTKEVYTMDSYGDLVEKTDADGNSLGEDNPVVSTTVTSYSGDVTALFEESTAEDDLLYTWIIKTDGNGLVSLDADHYVAGDSLITVNGGSTGLVPRGQVRVYELSPDYVINTLGISEDKVNSLFVIDDMWWSTDDSSWMYKSASTGQYSAPLILKFRTGDNDDGTKYMYVQEYNDSSHTSVGTIGGYYYDDDGELVYDQAYASASVTASDWTASGNLTITKYDAVDNEPLSGAVFRLLDADGNAVTTADGVTGDIDSDGYITVQSDGTAHVDGIPAGDYTLEETYAPVGYKLGYDLTLTITPGGMYEAEVSDDQILAGVKIQKRDPESGTTPQGGATFEGGTFDVITLQDCKIKTAKYSAGDVVLTLTLDADGYAESGTDALAIGSYRIVETGAPTGYLAGDSCEFTIESSDDGTLKNLTQGEITDTVKHGGITVPKIDRERDTNVPQGDATLAGTEYTIYNKSANSVYVDGKEYASGEAVMTITTDSTGVARTGDSVLPYGTYLVEETKAPTGYLLSGYSVTVEVHDNGESIEADKDDEQVIRGGISIDKSDYERLAIQDDGSSAQGDATLAGAVFSITNASANAVMVDGEPFEPGTVVALLVTDENGDASTAADLLPYGAYTITETEAPAGYLRNATAWKIQIRENGKVYDLGTESTVVTAGTFEEVTDQVIRGGVQVTKADLQSLYAVAEGAASLDDGEFTITNNSETDVLVNGTWYAPGEVVYTLTGADYDDTLKAYVTANDLLPYGTYTVTETEAPTGYLGPDESSRGTYSFTFTVREDGVIVSSDTSAGEMAITDQVERGDFSLRKIDSDSQRSMAGIQFRITSVTTGESYLIMTDDNGYYSSSSSWYKHTADTNGGTASSGLWFTGYSEEDNPEAYAVVMADIDNSLGALPYDTYTIEEIECEANKGCTMYSDTFRIYRDGYEISLGNIENKQFSLGTSVSDDQTGSQYAVAEEGTVLIDTVSYTNLDAGSYILRGVLMDKDSLTVLTDADGNEITAEKAFTLDSTSTGSVKVEFVFDATGLDGVNAVVYEYLFQVEDTDGDGKDEETQVGSHADPEDEDQSVYFPGIGTTALDSETGDHVSRADGEITLTDTVAYVNLPADRKYTVTGTLMLKSTGGEYLDDDGNAVTAKATFVSSASGSGTVELTFTFSGVNLEGDAVVAFEEVSRGGVTYAVHADIDDEDQTVYFPEIGTTAADGVTGSHVGAVSGTVTVTDVVTYDSVAAGKTYTITGTLYDKATGEALTDGDGNTFTASVEFTASESSGSVELTFEVPGSLVSGRAVVAFESLTYEGAEVAVHADIDDEDQTVYYPEIGTTAVDGGTGLHEGNVSDGTVTVVDTVAYKGLKPGEAYTMSGVLMDASTGEELTDGEGDIFTASAEFTASGTGTGTVELSYTVPASVVSGRAVVVFEDLYYEGILVASHADIEDEGQTVNFPEIHTTATDEATGLHEGSTVTDDGEGNILSRIFEWLASLITGSTKDTVTIVDTVTYSGLIPGSTHTMSGVLMDKATGEALTDGDGNTYIAEAEFTASETGSGSVDLEFTVAVSAVSGRAVVAFESLAYEGVEVAVHADIDDDDQTVDYPEIGTTAMDGDTGLHEGDASAEAVTVVDVVAYEGLIPGSTHTMSGVLMDKATGEALTDDEGNTFTAEAEFTVSETGSGTVELTFTIPGSAVSGKTIVAFEALTYEGIEMAVHADIDDGGQTVGYHEIHTTATDSVTGLHEGDASAEAVTVVDVVEYEGLIPGSTHTMSGVLMDKATGEALTDGDGNTFTAEAEFTASETGSGTVELEFTVPGDVISGKAVVAFEALYYEGVEVAVHADIDDEDQTVYYPGIRTSAKDKADGDQTITASGTVTIVDTVTYTGLIPGGSYRMTGVLMDQSTGKEVQVSGRNVTAETTFTASETGSGTVDVEFAFDASGLTGSLVVFETLYSVDTETGMETRVAVHQDITDEAQTITVTVPSTPGTTKTGTTSRTTPKTGVPDLLWPAVILVLLCGGVLIACHGRKRKGH